MNVDPINLIDSKERGRKRYSTIRSYKNTKNTRRFHRTTSPAGGNSAKCCPCCTPDYVKKFDHKIFVANEIKQQNNNYK